MPRNLLSAILAMVAMVPMNVLSPVRAAAETTSCHNIAVPVALAPGGAATYTVSGTLCKPSQWGAQGQRAADVDVLVPGATYTRGYWDWPIDPETYSFVAKTLRAGRATLAIDRIGSGASSHPVSAELSIGADAYVVHQLVAWARAGLGAQQITVVGHSLGSGVAAVEAATYHDTDRLVLTGMLHSTGAGLTTALASFQPALLMPPFLRSGYDAGYVTTVPGTRRASFYSASADPAVVAYDELHKDVVSGAELAGYPAMLAPPALDVTRRIGVPVLEVAGQLDALLCGGFLDCSDAAAVQAHEQLYYPAAPSLDTLTVPSTGHDLALHPSAPVTFDAISQWIETH
jgi:pimeloyl-ACP methyl ester carboxylesterase